MVEVVEKKGDMQQSQGLKIVMTGVSGCGKSLMGSKLAERLAIPFFDGDDFHSDANIQKMQTGTPLTDADRAGWLTCLNRLLGEHRSMVLACSALKPEYREQLKAGGNDLVFVYLKGDFDTIWARHQARAGHYFNGQEMLKSQFDALQPPSEDEAIVMDIRLSPEVLLAQLCEQLGKR